VIGTDLFAAFNRHGAFEIERRVLLLGNLQQAPIAHAAPG
jgi:hypothetical protein